MQEGDNDHWRSAPEVFEEWTLIGKDVGMEEGHAAAVDEMLEFALSDAAGLKKGFRALDAGCGNGWVVRRISAHPNCIEAIGVDAAPAMIKKAKSIDPQGSYVQADLMRWPCTDRFDLIHSMETMYYLADPSMAVERIASWLKEDGIFIMGVDHYAENDESLDWPQQLKTRMATLSQEQWVNAFEGAGLTVIRTWRAAVKEDWPGTLVVAGRR